MSSVALLDKTRKIGRLLHNNNSGKVVFNAEDKKEIYLMVYDIDQDISQALFFRRADTRGRKLETPGYIDAVDYDFWD